jgi:hypothetical protein
MQRLEECHQRSGFRRTQVLAIGWHISSALDHLPNELIFGKALGNSIERWPALPSFVIQRMTVVALLCLKNESSSTLQGRTTLQIF